MKITANIATYPPRLESLKLAVASLYDQVDVIRICFNGMSWDGVPKMIKDLMNEYETGKVEVYFPKSNLTDNGKFLLLDGSPKCDGGLQCSFPNINNPEYYFTCDDDLIYPPDYVSKTIEAIETYGYIVSYHGRVLQGLGRDYYRGHKSFHCLAEQKGNQRIDVCGTGVTAFDTRYFHPKGLANHKHQKMSDIIFSLEAAKQGKKIACIEHGKAWIGHTSHEETIHKTQSIDCKVQNQLADEIYTLNYGN